MLILRRELEPASDPQLDNDLGTIGGGGSNEGSGGGTQTGGGPDDGDGL